ncbi:hypothetical protein EYX55_04240 [Escherichia coli]|uniref:Uncharacterized protein n=1 Tax=Escherichia coli TaxID=562 RepID=A0A6C8T8C4_ECOLX|nr:hypothetical protein [Escherichia coli]KAE9699188.1 hypothetical protein GP721_24545 [Enterobacteriaceae bacterium TzEc077]EEV5624056.1 hypothetical protein [Escherichia coli]EEV6991821.1 hypothetical protein [Escherichia coli]EFA4747893.1 hypothetical protein [Escherichia coli]EFA5323118.1 hypothetical protein [Escherichia coli]
MQKREPLIIAPDYTDDELYEWMRGKIRAINDLKQATDHKERLSETLTSVTQDIIALAKSAALNVSRPVKTTD